tara:strand:- start:1514 stop:1738 length:225 start_codon:yes stop_codon:yes gene_type:complete
MSKQRTLNELRQVKTYGYRPPTSHGEKNACEPLNEIEKMVKVTPNDQELGAKIRHYMKCNEEGVKFTWDEFWSA